MLIHCYHTEYYLKHGLAIYVWSVDNMPDSMFLTFEFKFELVVSILFCPYFVIRFSLVQNLRLDQRRRILLQKKKESRSRCLS